MKIPRCPSNFTGDSTLDRGEKSRKLDRSSRNETLRLRLSLYKIRRREDWRVEIEAEDKDSDQNLNLEISSLPAPKVFSPEKKNSWLHAWCSRDTRKTITRLFYFGHVPLQSNMAGRDEKKKKKHDHLALVLTNRWRSIAETFRKRGGRGMRSLEARETSATP